MDIKHLIQQINQLGTETEKIEAKSGSEIGKSILETVCAFSNEPDLGGGFILLGIEEQKDQNHNYFYIVGVANADKVIEDLSSQCRTIFNYPLSIETKLEVIDNKVVIGIFVPEANYGIKPIFFKNHGLPHGALRRIGNTDVRCTEDDLLILYQDRNIESFDFSVVNDATFDDLDPAAIAEYRKERGSIHPNAEELRWSDQELLRAIGCLRVIHGELKPTIAGVLLFGTQIAIRKFLPAMRVDYIRESGNQWISDIENRFTSVEIRGSLMSIIRRTLATITDDLPKAFSLPEGTIQRKEIPIVPTTVIREAVVNALMHRNYRIHQSVQIIRYPNRIEIRNPGYSLITEEHLGEPGSRSRNPKISEVLHETRFAETKGSGIRIMRENMKSAGLSPPVLESNRKKDTFVATFLFHHFLNEEDLLWLTSFKDLHLSNQQTKALVFVRELGAIDNSSYRSLNHVDALSASNALRQLRDFNLLLQQNHGSATYYVPGQVFTDSLTNYQSGDKERQLKSKEHQLKDKEHQLTGKEHQPLSDATHNNLVNCLPDALKNSVSSLGRKAAPERLRAIIKDLCSWQDMTASQLTTILQRDKKRLVRLFLTPMIKDGVLIYKYPQMPGHPQQSYRTNDSRDKK